MIKMEQSTELENLLVFLKQNRGFDFTGYKRSSLARRIQSRMQGVGIDSFAEYQEYLEVQPEEFSHLFDSILINVTSFFRDPAAWTFLQNTALPQLLDEHNNGDPIRVWSAGCASGEEAYSVAMLLAELLGPDAYYRRVKIYATDVDEDALNKARLGVYSAKEIVPVPDELLKKYFDANGSTYSFRKDFRRGLIFGRNNLTQDAPISRIDLLLCRNTLMYFNAETQARILGRFHFALREGGVLFLGKAETLMVQNQSFTPLEMKLRFYAKVTKHNPRERALLANRAPGVPGIDDLVNVGRVRDAAMETAPLAQLVVDVSNTLVLANAQARALFNLRIEDLGRPFQDLEISFRPVELRSYLERVFAEGLPVQIAPIYFPTAVGEGRHFEVRLQPLFDNGRGLLGANIIFSDVSDHIQLERQLEKATQEQAMALEELQAAMEEMETTNEELQSAMEEAETTNEELQSANEELETMNEEMQSVNEELEAVNDELRSKTEQLNRLNEFMAAVMTSLRMGMAVLDRHLQVLVWNRQAEDFWGLRANEVEGTPFLNLDFGLPVESLGPALEACLATRTEHSQVVMARNRLGRKMECRVTTLPLLDAAEILQGVIVLMDETDNRGPDGRPGSEGR